VRARAVRAALTLCLLAGTAPAARASKPQPPLVVRLRLLSADASRGRYRVEVRLRADVALEEPSLTVRVLSREAGAAAARASGREPRASREPLTLAPGRELRRELDVLTGAEEPVTLLVGLGGHIGPAQLHRTSGLELGPASAPEQAGSVRTDALGRSYYEIRMPPARP
jgi:hypothetical protein